MTSISKMPPDTIDHAHDREKQFVVVIHAQVLDIVVRVDDLVSNTLSHVHPPQSRERRSIPSASLLDLSVDAR